MLLIFSLFNTVLPVLLYRVPISLLRWINMMLSLTLMLVTTKTFFELGDYTKLITYTIFGNWELTMGYDSIGLAYIWLTAAIFPIAFLAI